MSPSRNNIFLLLCSVLVVVNLIRQCDANSSTISEQIKRSSCPSGWKCSQSEGGYQIEELSSSSRLEMFYVHEVESEFNSIVINCHNLPAKKFKRILPAMKVGRLNTFHLEQCPLSDSFLVAEILQTLGVQGVISLYLYIPVTNETRILPVRLFSNTLFHNVRQLTLAAEGVAWPAQIFDDLENLNELCIGGNLTTLPQDIFRHQKKLEKLDISNSRFQALPDNLLEWNKDLKKFKMICEEVFNMSFIPPAFLANLPKLELAILNCGLTSVPGNLFANSSALSNIDMSNNRLEHLPSDIFMTQNNLSRVRLSNNLLTDIPDNVFQSNWRLTHLYLNNNKLTKISRNVVEGLANLAYLYLSDNFLNADDIFEKLFPMSHDFVEIEMANNLIDQLPTNWHPSRSLHLLDLSNNNISVLNTQHIRAFTNNKIKIHLNQNRIQRIDLEYLENLRIETGTFITVDLNDNPIHCDCKLLTFLEYTSIKRDKFDRLRNRLTFITNNLRCEKPKELQGKFVDSLQPMELICTLESTECPDSCSCFLRSYDNTLIVNCTNSRIKTIPDLSMIEQTNFKGIELHLEDNQLATLPNAKTYCYASVTHMYLTGNRLTTIGIDQLPANLTHLDIRRNLLTTISIDVLRWINESTVLEKVFLLGNPWTCDCSEESLMLQRIMKNDTRLIDDFFDIVCYNTPELRHFYELPDVCTNGNIYTTLAVVFAGFGLMLALYFKYQKEVKVWLYAHNMCLRFITELELDQDKSYDAFISYSHNDDEFISHVLVPELENGHPPFKLCVHARDFVVGECIPDQIIRAIEKSKRTLVVLSKNFIESSWSRMEFTLAHKAALNEGRNRVIVIIYGDIGDIDTLDDELQSYLKLKTYLKWGDPCFWKKLRYAMPH